MWYEMSQLIATHLPCTDCGSSDALAEYEKNTYCFSCGQSRSTSTEKSFFPVIEDLDNDGNTSLRMPSTSSSRLSRAATQWLLSHHIYEDLREKYNIRSVAYDNVNGITLKNRVIIPSYEEDGTLAFYQARALDEDDGPKYYTIGNKEYLFWSRSGDPYPCKDSIVLVEDMLSAIRVGEFTQSVSLIGTSINEKQLLQIVKNYAIIIVWMDGDSAGQKAATKLMKKFSLVSSKVFNIVTRQDPKCLYDGEIKRHLAPYID